MSASEGVRQQDSNPRANSQAVNNHSRTSSVPTGVNSTCRKRRSNLSETNSSDHVARSKRSSATSCKKKKTLGLIKPVEPPQNRWNLRSAKLPVVRCPNVVAGKDGIIRPSSSESRNKSHLNSNVLKGGVPRPNNAKEDKNWDNPLKKPSLNSSKERKAPVDQCIRIANATTERSIVDSNTSKGILEQAPLLADMVVDFCWPGLAIREADFPVSTNCDPQIIAQSEIFDKWKKQLMSKDPNDENALDLHHAMTPDTDGDRALHIAVVHQDVLLVRQLSSLIRSIGVSVDMYNHMRQTPLHLAVILQNPHLCEALIEEGAVIQTRDRHGNTALHLAIQYTTNESLMVLLRTKCSKDVLNTRNYEGLSCLHITILKKNMLAAYYLVKAGCDINIQEGKSGRTPLMNAVFSRHSDMVKILLKLGAKVECTDFAGNTALGIANELDLKDTITLLEARVNSRNKL